MANGKKPGGGVELAIVCFAAVLVAACIYVGTIILDRQNFDAVQTSNIIRNYGLLALGAIGFPLAIWRSWVAHLQTQEAIEQGRRVERQIQATEVNNLTTLLDKAAGLLADASNEKQRAALALLRHIGMSPVGDLGHETLDLLTDYIRRLGAQPVSDHRSLTALKYADQIAKAMHISIRIEVTFYDLDIEFLPSRIFGVKYEKCYVRGLTVGKNSLFKNCSFFHCAIDGSFNFKGECKFEESTIKAIAFRSGESGEFSYCDFTNCRNAAGVTPDMLVGCFYDEGQPPVPKVFARLGEYLSEHTLDF